MKRFFCLLTTLLMMTSGITLLSGCGKRSVYTSTYFDAFDTVLTLHIPASSPTEANRISGEIHDLVLELHRQFDIYHTYDGLSNLKTLNDHAGDGTPISLSEATLDLLTLGKRVYTRTDGRVNICMGAVLSLWHDARTKITAPPSEDALLFAAEHTSPDVLVIDKEKGTAMLTDAEASVDVGAIAKGYVADRVLAYAEEQGIKDLLFDLGGHVLALGVHPDGAPWRVGIRDPEDSSLYTTLEISDASVVTSGCDQRFYRWEGKTYHHLIDPATLAPADHHASVTVVIPLSHTDVADGLSTALFMMPEQDGKSLLSSWVPGAEGYWISN
ncbi:MAG: FAD:protein FMN transferase [Ruminococcaceae bacterium]|nr:FAD:protein FMN transferase [Oscillospiraceae bacterium]